MRSDLVSLFKIYPHRSLEAFDALMGDWKGFLISDDYVLYRRWDPEQRQACLAHLIRAANKHSEDPDPDIAKWGARLLKELRCLAQMSIYTFLRVPGVPSSYNNGERDLRTPVVRRKILYWSTDECGLRWAERIHSVLMTCRSKDLL